MAWSVSYYSEKVRNRVFALPAGILADYLRIVELLQEHGADLGMPHSRALGGGLFELRAKGREGIGRVLYCTAIGKTVIVLHSFVKKTQATPQDELRTARKRMKEVKRHG
ncbi:MAG: type II toxin-antitoxin system RelE/ParE family toxin [Betaproteobacteria bacterium]|nr:type II toxin-antitoxin system RelE/ParE family toxin [Betaproteobacteria bacterium]